MSRTPFDASRLARYFARHTPREHGMHKFEIITARGNSLGVFEGETREHALHAAMTAHCAALDAAVGQMVTICGGIFDGAEGTLGSYADGFYRVDVGLYTDTAGIAHLNIEARNIKLGGGT